MAIQRTSHDTTDAAIEIDMDVNASYELGITGYDQRFYPETAYVVMLDTPLISTGSFTLGTNAPNYNNILGATSWGLLGLTANAARKIEVLVNGGSVAPVAAQTPIYLKVNKGVLDSGGKARVVLEGVIHFTA